MLDFSDPTLFAESWNYLFGVFFSFLFFLNWWVHLPSISIDRISPSHSSLIWLLDKNCGRFCTWERNGAKHTILRSASSQFTSSYGCLRQDYGSPFLWAKPFIHCQFHLKNPQWVIPDYEVLFYVQKILGCIRKAEPQCLVYLILASQSWFSAMCCISLSTPSQFTEKLWTQVTYPKSHMSGLPEFIPQNCHGS